MAQPEKKHDDEDIDIETLLPLQAELTELGNAIRYAMMFGDEYKYIPELKMWFRWNRSHWDPDKDGAAIRNMDILLEDIKLEAEIFEQRAIGCLELAKQVDEDKYKSLAEANKKTSESLYKWYKASQSHLRIKSTLDLAKTRPDISTSIIQYDSKGNYLGVINGVINLRTGDFITGDPKYLITKKTGVEYDKDATSPQWEDFLLMIFDGDEELIRFIQRLIGQSLLGIQGKDKLAIFYGSGANGKSTFLDTLKFVIGEYASVTDPRVILEGGTQKEYYLAKLIGIRLLLMSETKKGAVIAEEIVKMMVDSGEISARFPYGRVFDYQPVFTPILSTNHKPHIGTDFAMWRRLLLIPFNYKIPDEKKDPGFRSKVLHPEAAGILNWCIFGCLEYQRIGLSIPQSVLDATNEYRDEQDKLGQFIDQYCIADTKDKTFRTGITQFRKIYDGWCDDEGLQAGGSISVKQDLKSRGFEVKKGEKGLITIYGLKIHGDSDSWVALKLHMKKSGS